MELLLGFFLGLLGTYLFWRFQINVQPRLVISSLIAKGQSNDNDGKTVYRIKIYNQTNRPRPQHNLCFLENGKITPCIHWVHFLELTKIGVLLRSQTSNKHFNWLLAIILGKGSCGREELPITSIDIESLMFV